MSSTLRLLRSHRRLFSTSPSSILNPSDPTTPLTSKQKSLLAHSLLKKLKSKSPPPSDVLSICHAASLSPSSHIDRLSLSLATKILSTSPSSVHSLIQDFILPHHPSHAIVLFGQADLLNDAYSTFTSHPSTATLNSLLLANIISKKHDNVSKYFKELPKSYNIVPDVTTYNNVVKSFAESGMTRSFYSVYEEMGKVGVKANATTYTNAVEGFVREEKWEDVKKVLGLMRRSGGNPEAVVVYNVRVEGLCKLRRTKEAQELVRKVKGNWVTYNHLIVGFCKEGELEEAKKVYGEMRGKKLDAESGCYFSLVHYLCEGGDFEGALRVCNDALGKNWVPGFKSMNKLVNGLVKIGKFEEGKEIVGKMKEKFPRQADMWKEVEVSFT